MLILVLANVAVFAWLRWARTAVPGPDAGLVAPPKGGAELELLPANASLSPAEPKRAAPAGPRCLTAGPATSATAVRALAAGLAQSGFPVRPLARRIVVTDSYQVLLSGFADRAKATAAAARLKRAGIHDVEVIAAAGQGAVISVGVFRSGADARRRVSQLEAMGFTPQVQENTRSATRWYLTVPASAAPAIRAAGSLTISAPAACSGAGAPASAARPAPGNGA